MSFLFLFAVLVLTFDKNMSDEIIIDSDNLPDVIKPIRIIPGCPSASYKRRERRRILKCPHKTIKATLDELITLKRLKKQLIPN